MRTRFLLSVFVLSLLISCTLKNPDVIPAKGEPGRLVLVTTDQLYNELDSILDDVFYEPQPWLAMAEAYFKISKMDKDAYRRSFIEYQTALFLITNNNFQDFKAFLPNMPPEKLKELIENPDSGPVRIDNRFAVPQRIYFLFANDAQDMKAKLQNKKMQILKTIYNDEVKTLSKRIFTEHSDTSNKSFKRLKSALGTGVALGDDLQLMKREGDFFWFGGGFSNEQLGALCYRVPYTDTSQFNDENLYAFRDSMTKEMVPGPEEGTYMKTSGSDLFPRFSEVVNINGQYGKKLRGWWTIEGEFMGGPYVLYAVLSDDNKYIFFYEGFIYSPNKSKSKNLRTLEAYGYTIK